MAEGSESILVFRKAFRTHTFNQESKWALGGFSGGPVVRTPIFQCRGHGFDP